MALICLSRGVIVDDIPYLWEGGTIMLVRDKFLVRDGTRNVID